MLAPDHAQLLATSARKLLRLRDFPQSTPCRRAEESLHLAEQMRREKDDLQARLGLLGGDVRCFPAWAMSGTAVNRIALHAVTS